jgi:hypothetical protein
MTRLPIVAAVATPPTASTAALIAPAIITATTLTTSRAIPIPAVATAAAAVAVSTAAAAAVTTATVSTAAAARSAAAAAAVSTAAARSAAATAAAAVSATTAAARSALALAGAIHADGAPVEGGVIQLLGRVVCVRVFGEVHEPKAPGPPCLAVGDHLRLHDLAVGREVVAQHLICRSPTEATHKQLLRHCPIASP